MPLHVELVSPERVLYQGEADMVVARTLDGEIAFLPGHAPFLGALGVGKVRVILSAVGGQAREEVAAVHGGFVEVRDDRVIVLSDVAELSSQIDVARAHEAKDRAEAALRAGDDAEAQAALNRAMARLDAAGGSGVSSGGGAATRAAH